MSDRVSDQKTLDRIRELQARRREIMALPSDEALARILSDPQPAALVHAFPESDFYILVHEIGPEDALPVLALASDRQWDHLVDLEGWARDRMEVTGATPYVEDPASPGLLVAPALPPSHPYNITLGEPPAKGRVVSPVAKPAAKENIRPAAKREKSNAGSEPVSW